MRLFHVLSSLLLLAAFPSQAQQSLALIIGNDAYANVPKLEKAVADARSISDALSLQGYQTITALDEDRRGMNRKIAEFTSRLEPGDNAVVFFAGHGVEIDGENYLLPTDIVAPRSGEDDFVKSESIALSGLLDRVRGTGARMAIVFVDACRNNPFEVTTGRSIGGTRGLGRIIAPQGTFVVFSAGAGQLALDKLDEDDGAQNSVFTRALLPRLTEPGLELRALVSDLRLEVRDLAKSVQHTQIPAYYDELLGEFYFTPAAAAAPAVAALPQPADTMRDDLRLARDIGTAAALDAFLDRYADRDDEYTYKVALQLRDGLTGETPSETPNETAAPLSRHADTDPGETPAKAPVETAALQPPKAAPAASPVASPVAVEKPKVETFAIVPDPREIIRETQVQLNALGCSAGGADGIVGKRTRTAFSNYISGASSSLKPGDLGSTTALEELRAATGTICKQPPPQTTKTVAAGPKGYSLTGSWSLKATCPLFITATGTSRLKRAGNNFYAGRLTNSLGQTANVEAYVNGRDLTGTDYFPGVTVTWRGRLAVDGKSFTATGSTGCSVYAKRTG